jgi:hypothetical protein
VDLDPVPQGYETVAGSGSVTQVCGFSSGSGIETELEPYQKSSNKISTLIITGTGMT